MIQWGSFTKEKNGEWNGLNDAAIYSFNSNIINSFVREMFQNSIDARDKKLPIDPATGKLPPLRIKINYKEIDQADFPDFEGFEKIFRKIYNSGPNKKHEKFFKNAFKVLGKNKKIILFVYEDFNTIGLSGDDKDPESNFNACVVSEGVSIKSGPASGGSFGIGKNSIYGLSKLRTVFYSSMDKDRNYIFQGKGKLASYYDKDGNTKDNKVYCGEGKTLSSIRGFENLPDKYKELFYRDEPGLSQYAMFPIEHEDWPEEFLKAILRNYWMLLEKNELEVELLKQDKVLFKIDNNNLEELLSEYFKPDYYEPEKNVEPIGNPYEYHQCFKKSEFIIEGEIDNLGKVKFYYQELENKNTNAIAYLRNDMVVYAKSIWGFGSIGYCGVFFCEDNRGNEVLSAMEPPTHDSFSPERLEEKHKTLNAKDGTKILMDIKSLIKEGLQKIKDKYTQPAEDIKWLDDIISGFTGVGGNGKGERKNEKSENETTEHIGEDISKTLVFGSGKQNSIINNKKGKIEGKGAGGPKNRYPQPGPGPGPDPGPEPGPNKGDKSTKKSKIRSRIFKTPHRKLINGKVHNNYRIHITSNQDFISDIILSQQGDSGNVSMFKVAEASEIEGKSLNFTEETNGSNETVGYRIENVKVPSVIQIYVDEPFKSSFKILN